MFHHRRSRDLSLLARGHGMLDGGVEIECFGQDPKAFSLSGKPLIKSAATNTIKPYKAHKLNLPKTFVTRRGQLVLFTAPEDMIIGKSCSFHEKEQTSQQAAKDLETTSRLLDSALDYYPEDKFHLKHKASTDEQGEREPDQMLTQPGHFTKVYLNSLKKAMQNAPQLAEDCLVEDIEESRDKECELLAPCNSEVAPVSECDSGLGQSTISRISGLSKLSEDRTVFIPHGSDEGPCPAEAAMPPAGTGAKDDALVSLKNELLEQKNGSKTKKAPNTKVGKKRHRSTNKQDSTQSPAPVKAKAKKSNTETKSGKARRRRNKKDPHTTKHDCDSVENEKSIEGSRQEQQMTAINVTPSEPKLTVEGVGEVNSSGESVHKGSVRIGPTQAVSRAEERRREIERKRAEKRELEAQRKREMEEKLRLEEELARAAREATPLGADDQSDTASMTSVESAPPQEKSTTVEPQISNQARLRAELDRSKLSQHRWLLMSQGEKVEKDLSAEMDEAQEVLRRAREAEEERRRLEQLRLQKMAEEKRRLAEEQAQLEEAARRKAAEILSHSHKQPDHTKRLDSELSRQRQEQMFPSKLMFSYFNYVPPPKIKKDKKARGRAPKAKPIRAQ